MPTLADLWNTEEFKQSGESQLYGLELTEKGYYRRAVITPSPHILWLSGASAMTGHLNMGTYGIKNMADSLHDKDAVTKIIWLL